MYKGIAHCMVQTLHLLEVQTLQIYIGQLGLESKLAYSFDARV